MAAPRAALQIGDRTVLVMTCRGCGRLLPGSAFDRYRRSPRDKIAYLTRRCREMCRWAHMDRSPGKSRSHNPRDDPRAREERAA